MAHNNNVILNEKVAPDLFQPISVAPFLSFEVVGESISFEQLKLIGQITFRLFGLSHLWVVVTGCGQMGTIYFSVCLCHFKISFTPSQFSVDCEISMGRKTNFRYIPLGAFNRVKAEKTREYSKVKAREKSFI